MKRNALFVLLLVIFLCFGAPSVLGEGYTAPGVFSIAYDDSAYTLDTVAYADENIGVSNGAYWFFILYNDTFMFDASMTPIEGYEGMSLCGADADARQSYVDDMLDIYGSEDAQLLTMVPAGSQGVPFYVFSCRDESGAYLMAETVIKGRAIDFLAYYNDSALPADDALAQALTELLSTFEPI